MSLRLLILGAGGIAIVAAEIARYRGYDIVGFLDDKPEKQNTTFCGAPILGEFGKLSELRHCATHAAIAFSDAHGRLNWAGEALSCDYLLPNLIHPSAIISPSASVNHGAIIMPGSIINSGARIGPNMILNTAASIDHECSVGCGVHIGPGARLSGLVTIGSHTWIGVGSVVRENVRIGRNVLIGAGSLVLEDVPDGVVSYGWPARVIRRNQVAVPTAELLLQ